MTKHFFTFLFLLLNLSTYSQIEVWGFKGTVLVNDISIREGQKLESGVVLKLSDKSSYVCLIDWGKPKLIELNGIGVYSFDEILEKFVSAPVLPAISESFQNKFKYMQVVGDVYRCRCIDNDPFSLFPLMKQSVCIEVFEEDSISIVVERNKKAPLKFDTCNFSVLNFYDEKVYQVNLKSDYDSLKLIIPIIKTLISEQYFLLAVQGKEEVSQAIIDKAGKVKGSRKVVLEKNISNIVCVRILTKEESIQRKQILSEILKNNSPGYWLYAALWAIENKLVFKGTELFHKDDFSQYIGFSKYYQVFKELYIRK